MDDWRIFLRHAHRETGWESDNGLSEKGRAQGQRLRAYFEALGPRFRPDRIFSSPKIRCQETAAFVADDFNMEVEILPGLDEQQSFEDERAFRARLSQMLESAPQRAVLCTHGDVLPLIARAYGARAGTDIAKGDLFIVEKGQITVLSPLSKKSAAS
jgi:broad specificity phosphatase PhoE